MKQHFVGDVLRDLTPDKLGCAVSDTYRRLLKVPETMTRKDFRATLSKEHEGPMETNFATRAEPECYHPRGGLLFGNLSGLEPAALPCITVEGAGLAEF